MDKLARYKILTEDRTGISAEILNSIYKLNIDLKTVEVNSKEVTIKIKKINDENLMKVLKRIDGVKEVKKIEWMDSEKNEKNLSLIMDSINAGVMSVGSDMKVQTCNKLCEEIFGLKKEDLIDKKLINLGVVNDIVETLLSEEEDFEYREFNLKTPNKEIKVVISAKKLYNNEGDIFGVMLLFFGQDNFAKVSKNFHEGKVQKRFIGKSLIASKIKKFINIASESNSNVLILGESGTGKEVLAKEIVFNSNRHEKPFISVNCAALPSDLIESELFGYKKGAFTGATCDKKGLFLEADTGTLFLDEVGELGLLTQAKLLRVLQEKKLRRVGSSVEENVDVRIICATNKDLETLVKEKKFREDLYYRLNVLSILIPPLDKRKEDIPMLVDNFISELSNNVNKNIEGYSDNYIKKLMELSYKGNVRELKNIVERTMNLCEGKILTSNTIEDSNSMMKKDFYYNEEEYEDINDMKKEKQKCYVVEYDREKNSSLKKIVEELEKQIILTEMRERRESVRKSAARLGMSHTTLINKCIKYKIKY
ncbi:sigma 54-interacting transcriptional regulator [Peptostreptococcus faecalis]|uniref:sigma 54-interacting transcriptional regulator n=1 Tax=Peptostreptococcus faecalis TaxID=2045015 RepID=UPI000C7D5A6D|nr:sigma 54-interacting transcriptional regulator [Peptostreptococcus faecalis]